MAAAAINLGDIDRHLAEIQSRMLHTRQLIDQDTKHRQQLESVFLFPDDASSESEIEVLRKCANVLRSILLDDITTRIANLETLMLELEAAKSQLRHLRFAPPSVIA